MANSEKIAKLKAALNSPITPKEFKNKILKTISELEAEDKLAAEQKKANEKIEAEKEKDRKKIDELKAKKPIVTRSAAKMMKQYYLHKAIKTVTILEDGKKVMYKGSDVLNGAQFLARGGRLSDISTYVPIRNIVSVELEDGEIVHPANGYHIKDSAKPIAEKGMELDDVILYNAKDKEKLTVSKRKSDGMWTIYSESPLWKKRDDFESGFASKEDALHVAKVQAGYTKEYKQGGNIPVIVSVISKTKEERRELYNELKETFPDNHISKQGELGIQFDSSPSSLLMLGKISKKHNSILLYKQGGPVLYDFNYENFLNELYPKVAAVFEKSGLVLEKNYAIKDGSKKYHPTMIFSKVDFMPKTMIIGYWDDNQVKQGSLGEIEFELDEKEFHVKFPSFKINDVEMYAKGGWTTDYRYLNKNERYEVDYAKGKNRKSYMNKGGKTKKLEKGGVLKEGDEVQYPNAKEIAKVIKVEKWNDLEDEITVEFPDGTKVKDGSLSFLKVNPIKTQSKYDPKSNLTKQEWMEKYNRYFEGGGPTQNDLFEHYDELPADVLDVLNKYGEESEYSYEELEEMQNELNELGYTFDYGLDAVPYNLRETKELGGDLPAGSLIHYQMIRKTGGPIEIGRLAKGKTLSDIASMHNVSLAYIEKQMNRGAKIEMEHTTDINVARAIAKDHLFETPDYYIQLSKIEMKKAGGPIEKKLAELTSKEDKAWENYFTYYLDEGYSEKKADKQAWIDLKSEFPRLNEFDGIKYKKGGKITFKSSSKILKTPIKTNSNDKRKQGNGNPVFAKAREIRLPNEKWQTAIQRAKVLLKS